eukprot:1158677-Pelagomonas_calceolata.AAC.4
MALSERCSSAEGRTWSLEFNIFEVHSGGRGTLAMFCRRRLISSKAKLETQAPKQSCREQLRTAKTSS